MNGQVGEGGQSAGYGQLGRALLSMYALLLLMECRTLPGILRVRPPAPDLLWVSVVLQGVLLLSLCLRVVRITRLFLRVGVLAGVPAH